jgi:hypothetical protein
MLRIYGREKRAGLRIAVFDIELRIIVGLKIWNCENWTRREKNHYKLM